MTNKKAEMMNDKEDNYMTLEKFIERCEKLKESSLATTEDNMLCDWLKELVEARKKINNLKNTCLSIDNAWDEGTIHNWYIDSVGTESPVWTEEHISELYNDFYIFPKPDNFVEYSDGKTLFFDLTYWCNDIGDCHNGGEWIKPEELPEELYHAYMHLWTDKYDSICYLVKYKGEYGIALVNEFDRETARFHDTTLYNPDFWVKIRDKALKLSKKPLLAKAKIIVAKGLGFDCCHEIMVFFPWNTSKETIHNVADLLKKEIYDI